MKNDKYTGLFLLQEIEGVNLFLSVGCGTLPERRERAKKLKVLKRLKNELSKTTPKTNRARFVK